jgi:flagellar protein FlaJ
MAFSETYRNVASRYMNKTVEPYLKRFESIHSDLKKANMPVMLREYVSMCAFTALIILLVSFPVSLFLLILLKFSFVYSLLLSLGISLGATALTFTILVKYPATRADERRRNIDNNLPFATLYMNTIAGTGSPPYAMFKLLSEFKEYGEVSAEAQGIVKDIEVMGQDIEVALKRAAEQTPSEDFRDLLWSMITTIVRGGDLKILLQEKAQLLLDAYRRKLDEYTDNLTMYVEVYITLVIVGTIFAIVMASIMGAISGFGGLKYMQLILVYVYLPVASIVFIVLLKLTSPVS